MSDVIICSPLRFPLRRRRKCPTCDRVTRFSDYAYVWYSTTWTCVRCGDSWTDGERHERPFKRGWRLEATARAQQVWVEAGSYTDADFQAWFEARHGS